MPKIGLISDQKCTHLETVSIDCPIGKIDVICCPKGLHRLSRSDQTFDPKSDTNVVIIGQNFVSNNQWINESINWFQMYFGKHDKHIDQQLAETLPKFCLNGTQSEFCRKVWTTLRTEIKFGKTISYSDLAVMAVGNPKASRAVGTAMKTNPYILMIPCHRVTKSNGDIGHYSAGGSGVKHWLLSFEKQNVY